MTVFSVGMPPSTGSWTRKSVIPGILPQNDSSNFPSSFMSSVSIENASIDFFSLSDFASSPKKKDVRSIVKKNRLILKN